MEAMTRQGATLTSSVSPSCRQDRIERQPRATRRKERYQTGKVVAPPSGAPVASKKANPEGLAFLLATGAGERSRTPDLRITNALLYQLSYTG